mgnify:CR=1 FL=1
MKKFLALSAAATLALSGCIAPAAVETAAVDTGREAAKAVVGPIVAETIPGAAGVVLTDCIIDNATGAELVTLAATGASPENVTLVSDILSRPDTVTCATSALT